MKKQTHFIRISAHLFANAAGGGSDRGETNPPDSIRRQDVGYL
jgi:hypothetical protein